MNKLKIGILGGVCAISFVQAGIAQDSYSGIYPDLGLSVDFSTGYKNIDENKELEQIPGASSDYNAELNLLLKGKFSRMGEWAVEKEDGIEERNGLGYEAGVTLDITKLYEASDTTKSYSSSSDTNHYSLIQPMIDWYEKNQVKYGLPADPCNVGSPWPTTSYGAGTNRYQFIVGSTVEQACDVNWTTQKWADAEALYQEIKYDISNAIDQLNTDIFPTGDVSQISYASMSDSDKKLAELKMKAKREFEKVCSGKTTTSGNSLLDAVDSAYIKITNIGGVVDSRVDFLGKRLSVGNALYSALAGQSTSGSALCVSLKHGFVEGLEASLSTGIAGGVEQESENYDTAALDYYRGIGGEWAVKGEARYTRFFEPFNGTGLVFAQAILTDVTEARKNFAANAGLKYSSNTFVNWSVGAEGMFINWKDREVDSADYETAFAVAANASVGAFGANLKLDGQFKSDRFSHKTWCATQDRFYGYSANSDFYIANLENAAKFKAELEFNPQYFVGYDFVNVSGGVDGFLYDNELNGLGFFANLSLGAEDFINLPLTLFGGFDYYKNSELIEWDDYSTLPEQDFMEFTTVKAGLRYNPVKYLELSCEYASRPSYSRRETARNSSFTLNGKINLD